MSPRLANLALALSGAITGATVFLSPMSVSQAQAGGCETGKQCYVRVRQPDTYAVQHRPVLISPGYQSVHMEPNIVGWRQHRVTALPGHWNAERVPAIYGTRSQKVLVRPAQVTWQESAGYTKTVTEQRVIRPGGVRWEMKVDAHGRKKLCKVEVPAVTETVSRKVYVPGKAVPIVQPAIYRHVDQHFRISPERTRFHYTPGVHQWVREPVLLKPAEKHIVQHPPVYGVEHHKVRVPGGHAWEPADHHD